MSRLALILFLAAASGLVASPPPPQFFKVQQVELQELDQRVVAEETRAGKVRLLVEAWKAAPGLTRHHLLQRLEAHPGPETEAHLLSVLRDDQDAAFRQAAALALGRVGSERSLAALEHSAAEDRETMFQGGGCVVFQADAREAAAEGLALLEARLAPRVAADHGGSRTADSWLSGH